MVNADICARTRTLMHHYHYHYHHTMSESLQPKFSVVREDTAWVATHTETGIASHGDDPNEAVAMATEAVELVQQDPEPASMAQQETIRRELGIEVTDDERGIDSPNGMP